MLTVVEVNKIAEDDQGPVGGFKHNNIRISLITPSICMNDKIQQTQISEIENLGKSK